MPQYGLIGYPLTHSFSGTYFTEKFKNENILNHRYDLFPLSNIIELPDLLATHDDLRGLNVTIPYKEQILPYLDGISDTAKEIGAVNTISIKNGKLFGDNTDVYGFEQSLLKWLDGELPNGALILGTGGASKAIQYVLNKLGIPFQRISRKEEKGDMTYIEINKTILTEYPLIINTTPLGTYPKVDAAPDLPYVDFTSRNKLYDLVYNPEKTLFLKYGMAKGCPTINGHQMLILQAERSWEIWNTQ